MKYIVTITFETDQEPTTDQFLHTMLSDLNEYYGNHSCKSLELGD